MADRTAKSLALHGAGQRITVAVAALFLGAFFVFGAGLANSAILHDTAHDVRHAYGFPCH